ncbi:MAG: hypothetical protein ACRCZP_14480 [Phycicoccus sp.]
MGHRRLVAWLVVGVAVVAGVTVVAALAPQVLIVGAATWLAAAALTADGST